MAKHRHGRHPKHANPAPSHDVTAARATSPESVYADGRTPFQGRLLPELFLTGDTALTYGPVFSCLRVTIEPICAMPFRHFAKLPDGGQHELDSDIAYLLNIQPNSDMTAYDFKKALLLQSRLWGAGYAEIERDAAGRPINLWPLSVERMFPKRQFSGGPLYYEYHNEVGGTTTLQPTEVLHLKGGLTYDGITSYAPLQLAAKAMALGIAEERFGLAFFGNGAVPGGIIENKGRKLDPATLDNLLKTFNDAHQGPSRAHRVLYLDSGMEYKPITIPLETAQFLESRTFQVEEIARWFGVPPHKLGLLNRAATTGDVEQQNLQFVGDVLIPIMTGIESECAIKLLGRNNRGKQYFKLDPTSLLRGDLHSRYNAYSTAIQWGFMTRNEVRLKEDMTPLEYLDEPLLPVNMTTAEKLATTSEMTGDPGNLGQLPDQQEPSGDGMTPMAALAAQVADLANSFRVLVSQVSSHLTMQASGVKHEMPAFTVNVQPPQQDIRLSPSFQLSALQPDVNIHFMAPGQPAIELKPSFNIENQVATPDVRVSPNITVEAPIVNLEVQPQVTVEPAQAPAVTVENAFAFPESKPQITIENEIVVPEIQPRVTVENAFTLPESRPQITIENEVIVPDIQPQVTVENEINVPETKPHVTVENQITVAPSPAPDVFLQVDRGDDDGKE